MIYIILVYNLIVFIVYGIDKYKAKNNMYRISEKTLITMSSLMGSLGACIAMLTFNHKTSSMKFKIKYVFSVIINIFIIFIYYKFVV